MPPILKYFSILAMLVAFPSYSQEGASSCGQLAANFSRYQACATTITFENSVGNLSGENFSTSCIGSAFNGPTWFFIKIKDEGDMTLHLRQVTTTGAPSDVDFVLWGPFQNMDNICNQLNISNEKDCSYSPDSQEIVNIPFSQAGDIYILLIDNYDNIPGNITMSQIGGSGSTDCDFLSTVKITDDNNEEITQLDYCKPETVTLYANVDASDFTFAPENLRFNYKWFRNNQLVATTNATAANQNTFVADQTGIYKVVISAYDVEEPPANMNDLSTSEATINLNFSNNLLLNAGPHSVSVCDYTLPFTDGKIVYDLYNLTQVVTSETAPIHWEFSLDDQFTNLIANPTTFANDNPYNFSIYVRGYFLNQNLNCYSNISKVNVQVNVLPGSDTTLATIHECSDTGFANFDLTIREAILNLGIPANSYTVKYYENINDAIANNNNFIPDPRNFTNTVKDEQVVYLQINSNTFNNSILNIPCNLVIELNVKVTNFPSNNLNNSPYKICVDENGNVISKAVIDTKLPHGDYEFIYYREFDAIHGNQLPFGNTNIFTTDVPGDYSVKIMNITNGALCTTIANFTVRNSIIPTSVTAIPSELVGFENENTVTIVASPPSTDYQYMINDIGWQNDNVFYNVAPGIYQVRVRNKFECGEANTTFIIADYPKFFTPNSDGYNDTWKIGGLELFDSAEIRIFDRYGKLLKDITNNPDGWDGTLNNQLLPADDYWFTIKYIYQGAILEYKNHFSLKR